MNPVPGQSDDLLPGHPHVWDSSEGSVTRLSRDEVRECVEQIRAALAPPKSMNIEGARHG